MAYFANGSEGEYLDAQCGRCPLVEKVCPIYAVQFAYNYAQLDKGNEKLREAMEILIDKDGNCQMFPLIRVDQRPKNEPPAWLEETAQPKLC